MNKNIIIGNKMVIFLMLISVITGYLAFWFSSVVGYKLTKRISARKEKGKGVFKSFKIKIKNYYFHLHHWLMSILAMILLVKCNFFNGLANQIVFGLLVGVAWQGIYCYRDWYRIFYK